MLFAWKAVIIRLSGRLQYQDLELFLRDDESHARRRGLVTVFIVGKGGHRARLDFILEQDNKEFRFCRYSILRK